MDELNNTLSPMVYLKILFRRKELFLVPLYAGLILGICAAIVMPKKYQSSTVILVEEGKTDNPLFEKIAVSTTVTQRLTAIQESMLGWNSLIKLVKRLNLDKDVKTPKDLEQLINDIRKNILIHLKGQNIINLSYNGPDPEQTQAVVKNITDIFIERNKEIQDQETADAITFIEAQLKVYEGKIKSTEIAKLQDQLNVLLVDSTENHPKVKELKSEIAKKKEELAKQNLQFSESVVSDTKTDNPIIEEIKRTLNSMESSSAAGKENVVGNNNTAAPDKDIYKLMLLDRLDNAVARDADVNTGIYNMLLQRLETAKITQRLQASKEGTKYTILDPPRVPLEPFQPNKPLIVFVGMFFGAVLGAFLVVVSEFLDKSFLDVEEAKEYLGVPLLGAISKINTIESVHREREQQVWFASLTLVAGVIVVIMTVVISGLIK